MKIRDLVRGGLLLAVGGAVLWMEHKRRARPCVEPRSVHTTRNLAVAGIAAATVQLLEAPVVIPLARAVTRRRWGLTELIGGPPWFRTILGVLLLDYTLYLWHMLVHRVPWLWRFHLVHHVDQDLDATTGLRFHAGELALSVPWRAAQVILIGVNPATLTAWQSLTIASVLFHHSNVDLGEPTERLLSRVVATPRMHAIHHSVNPALLQSNFSSGLSIWDHLHGTARVDVAASEVTVGVPGYLGPGDADFGRILHLPFERVELPPWPGSDE